MAGGNAGTRVLTLMTPRGDEARRSLQITVHTAVFHKGHGNKGLGFR